MLLELLKPLSFFATMLSLYPVLLSAFFVPGTRWEERFEMALLRLTLAACIAFTSGVVYALPDHPHRGSFRGPHQLISGTLLRTLPVRVFFCALAAMAILFTLTWYLDTYYVPLLLHRGCCRP